MVGLTRTLAHELGPHNIRVNAVFPGATLTERQRKLWFSGELRGKGAAKSGAEANDYAGRGCAPGVVS